MPLVRALPSILRPEAEPGAQPKPFYLGFRQGIALPHIRRRSRNGDVKGTFVQSQAQVLCLKTRRSQLDTVISTGSGSEIAVGHGPYRERFGDRTWTRSSMKRRSLSRVL